MYTLFREQIQGAKRVKVNPGVENASPEDLKKQVEKLFEAINKRSFDVLPTLFSDAATLEELDEIIEGKTNIVQYFEKGIQSWRSLLICYTPDSLIVNNDNVIATVNYSYSDSNLRRYISKTVIRAVFTQNLCIENLIVHYDKIDLLTQISSSKLKIPVAIVTGSASGLGAAIAKRFYEDGMLIAVVDINEVQGRKKAEELQGNFFKADVSESHQVETVINNVYDKYGRVDCVVNNAGITGPRSPIVGYPDDLWHKVLKVDLDSVYYGMKFALRVMQKQGYGVIINMSSVSGIVGYENVPAYTSAKAAIIGLTRATALEAARYGVRINALCPTGVLTESAQQLISSSSNPSQIEKQFSSYNPLPGSPRPLDIARAASFLASEESRFITGFNLVIDGGYTAK